ncbi:MAG: HAMP domain-containing sensor histidine kinase [Bacteroidota bacterium]
MDKNEAEDLSKCNEVLKLLMAGDYKEGLDLLNNLDDETTGDQKSFSFNSTFKKFIYQYFEGVDFINALADGNLDFDPPRQNYVISHYKQLQSNLRHLTWQTQQVARGDYNQKVSYLGEFSVAFNQMTDALREKKKIEDQLRELYASRDLFMSIISHDLRSPFNGILGFIDLLLQEYHEITDEERIQYIQNIQSSSQTAFNLLENLLEWSRIQTGKIQLNFEKLNIGELIDETILLLQTAADKKQILLNSLVKPDCFIYADKNSMLTAIRNLLSNALKFTPKGGQITVRAAQAGSMWEISISDTGIGISPENLANLFFTGKVVKTRGTDNEKGTGLGLILCKEFIEKNGGTIRAQSNPGFGSTFIISLPGLTS